MKRTEVSLDIESIPLAIRQYIKGATFYDSSCSANAKTLFVSRAERAFLKISKRSSLEREYKMTRFLHKHNVAPNAIAYEYLKMLHSLPTADCPYDNRTNELLQDAQTKGTDLRILNPFNYSATDNVDLNDYRGVRLIHLFQIIPK